jgi:hypothetical protein
LEAAEKLVTGQQPKAAVHTRLAGEHAKPNNSRATRGGEYWWALLKKFGLE